MSPSLTRSSNQMINDYEIFCRRIWTLLQRHPCSVTSWWRSPHRNRDQGGLETSHHLLGTAVDIILDPGANKTQFLNDIHALNLHWKDEGDHFHIQDLPGPNPRP